MTKITRQPTPMSESRQLQKRIDPQTPLHQLRQERHEDGRDLKVIITARNSTTGTGKTTLACWLALNWDDDWTADERATMHVNEFLDLYTELPKESVLLMDEAEQVDARRSMSHKNVNFAEKWMMMRVRQVDSILTLPTSSALDKRLKELADVRINVTSRGTARCYRIVIDDHDTSNVREHFMHKLTWPALDGHPDMETLDDMKQEKIQGATYDDDDDDDEPSDNLKWRNTLIREKWANADDETTQQDIADELKDRFGIELTPERISQIVNGKS